MDLREIAETVGYADPSGAHRAIQAGLRMILPEETRDQYRRLEIARLDALQEAHWEAATLGEPRLGNDGEVVRDFHGEPMRCTPSQRSAAIVLRCISQRSRLFGLDAPARVDVTLQDGEMVEVGVLQVLDEEHMEMALKLRDQVAALSRLQAGGRIS